MTIRLVGCGHAAGRGDRAGEDASGGEGRDPGPRFWSELLVRAPGLGDPPIDRRVCQRSRLVRTARTTPTARETRPTRGRTRTRTHASSPPGGGPPRGVCHGGRRLGKHGPAGRSLEIHRRVVRAGSRSDRITLDLARSTPLRVSWSGSSPDRARPWRSGASSTCTGSGRSRCRMRAAPAHVRADRVGGLRLLPVRFVPRPRDHATTAVPERRARTTFG